MSGFYCLLQLALCNHLRLCAALLLALYDILQSSELLALQHSDVLGRPEGYHLLMKV